LPGKSHFDLYKDGLLKQIGKEMEQTSEQGTAKMTAKQH